MDGSPARRARRRDRSTSASRRPAACCSIAQAAIDVGLFDERYFIGKEDGDFTHRMRLAGYRILELPDALVLHHSRPRGTWLFYYQIRNRWHFMLKNYQWRTLILMLPCLAVHEPLQLVVLHAKGHGRVYWKAVAGLIALLPSLPRDRALTRRIRVLPDAALLEGGPPDHPRRPRGERRSSAPAKGPTKGSSADTGVC